MAANRLRSGSPALAEAERTLRLLNRLATVIREEGRYDDHACEELTTNLLALMRVPDGSYECEQSTECCAPTVGRRPRGS